MKRRIYIEGPRVQDVGYRALVLELADSLGILGLDARNLPRTGNVEVLVEGDQEAVEELIDLLREKIPSRATVDSVEVESFDGEVKDITEYAEKFSIYQSPKIVAIGREMLDKQDEMLGKQDQMLDKQDSMLDKQDQTISVIREEGEKTRKTVSEESQKTREELSSTIREESDKTRSTIRKDGEKTRHVFDDHVVKDLEDLRREFRDLRDLVESKL